MNIQTVKENLQNTIAGKVKYLIELEYALTLATMAEGTALTATIAFLKINIAELKHILQDVEQCLPKEPEFHEDDSEDVRNLIRMGR